MRTSRALITLAIVVVSLIVPTSAVWADCANPPSLEVALAESSVAFIGEVTEARFDSGEAVIRVLWIWKGDDLRDEVVVRAPGDETFPFRVGATYIVIPQNVTEPFELDGCSGTRMYRGSGEEIPQDLQAAAGSLTGRAPGGETDGTSGDGTGAMSLQFIVAALGLVGLAAIGVYRLRSRSSERSQGARGGADLPLSESSGIGGAGQRRGRRVGGPLSWSARSGQRQVSRLRRGAKQRRVDVPD